MATALIKITQGATVGTGGQALLGVTGTAVVFSNTNDAGVVTWKYQLVDVPPGSTVPLVTQGPNATPTFSMGTPDKAGSYRVELTVTDINGVTDVDIRNFIVPFTGGLVCPPFMGNPKPLPLTGTGSKPHEMNYGGQAEGWSGLDDGHLLYAALKKLDGLSGSSGAPGGVDGNVQFKSGSSFAGGGSSGVMAVVSGTQLAFGGTVATGGLINSPHGQALLRGRNNAGSATADVVAWGTSGTDRASIGDTTNAAGFDVLIKSGGNMAVKVAGTTEYTLDATALTMNGNNVVGAGFYSGSGTVAASGLLRGAHGSSVVAARNNANSADAALVSLGIDGTDIETIGADTAVASIYNRAATEQRWYVGAAQKMSLAAVLAMGATAITLGATPAASGAVRATQNTVVVAGRNNANSADVALVTWGSATDRLWLGDSSGLVGANVLLKTGGDFTFNVNGTPEYVFDAAQLNWEGNNSVGAGFYSGVGSVAASGLLRGANASTLVAARNAAGSADVIALAVDGSNVVVLGGAGTPNAVRVYANATTNFTAAINGTDEYTFSATVADFTNNVLQFGTNPAAAAGLIRVPANVTVLAGRNSANTGDVILMNWATATDRLIVGDSNNVQALQVQMKTGGTGFDVRWASLVEYNFNESRLDMGDNFLQLGTSPASVGLIRVPSNVVLLAGRNAANSGNLSLFYTDSSDDLIVGDFNGTAGTFLDVKTGGLHTLRVNNVGEYTYSSTIADFKDNSLQFGTNPALAGLIRTPTNTVIVQTRNNANTGDLQILKVDGSDQLIIASSVVAGEFHQIASAGQYDFKFGATSTYNYTSTIADFKTASLQFETASAGSSAAAGAGLIRVPGSPGTIIGARNYSNTGNISVLGLSGDGTTFNDLRVGDSSTTGNNALYLQSKGFAQIQINSVDEYDFNSTSLLMNGNNIVMAGGFVSFGTNPAASGAIRVPHTAGTAVLTGRNSTNSGDMNLMAWGADGNEALTVGGGLIAGVIYQTAGTHSLQVNAVAEYTFSSTTFDLKGNHVVSGADSIITPGVSTTPLTLGGPNWGTTVAGADNATGGQEGVKIDINSAATLYVFDNGGLSYKFGANTLFTLRRESGGTGAWINIHNGNAPASNPGTGSFYIFMDNADNKLKARGPSGTITSLALP